MDIDKYQNPGHIGWFDVERMFKATSAWVIGVALETKN